MKFWRYFLLICAVPTAFAGQNAAGSAEPKLPAEFQDGRDYFSYRTPIHLDKRNDNRILIQSFFNYDCRVCVNTQDILLMYSQINPNKVIIEEYPVATKETPFSARVYYSLKQMRQTDLSDLLLFETANPKNYRAMTKFENLSAWLKEQKADVRLFTDIYQSAAIEKKVNEAIYLTEKYGVFTYPFVVIEGKYVLTNSTLYNDDYTFAVLDFLVQKLTVEERE